MIAARFEAFKPYDQNIEQIDLLRVSFDRVWPWLRKAVEAYGPTHSKADVWRQIEDKTAQLWTTEHGAIVTTVETWPTGFKEVQVWLAGGVLEDVISLQGVIEDWAKSVDCKRVVIVGRAGWKAALPDYKRASCDFVKDI